MVGGLNYESPLRLVLDNPRAKALVSLTMPGTANSPTISDLLDLPIGAVADRDPVLGADSAAKAAFFAELAASNDDGVPTLSGERFTARTDYEDESVAQASAAAEVAGPWLKNSPVEIVLAGPSHGNPFTDVEVGAWVTGPEGERFRAGGFYDGDGRYIVRFLPSAQGTWRFVTESTARSLTGITGEVAVADSAERGPVRVADQFHFSYDNGERYSPWGTTAYVWNHQPAQVRAKTLETLARSPFTKLRMCVFPKSYLYNTEEPRAFPFPKNEEGTWDVTRFDVEFFRGLEERIRELGRLGIEADLILFHPYDRWGFAEMPPAADDRYVEYVTRRLSALPNVWWAMANEHDLMDAKSVEDWERLASIVRANDPVGHLQSIHNCFHIYDHAQPWITHVSMQRVDVYKTTENTDRWRSQWGKPVVVDECGYEGDLDLGWGNITAPELVRRAWECAVRGGYMQHGETFYRDDHRLWWSKGGTLIGESPERLRFLAKIVADAPGGVFGPLPSEWDVPHGGVSGEYVVIYLGFGQPRERTISLAPGTDYTVDVIDTWNMTIKRLAGTYSGSFVVPLPSKQYMALRLMRVTEDLNS